MTISLIEKKITCSCDLVTKSFTFLNAKTSPEFKKEIDSKI